VELALGLVAAATGARADVLVRAPEGASLADVSADLLARVLEAGGTGELSTGGVPLAGTELLGVPPLVQGALLVVDAAPAPDVLPGLPELRVVGGPGSGGVHRLSPGTVRIGRDAACGVRLDDPDVSRRHCRLTVTHTGGSVADLGSTNGTFVDGRPVGPEDTPLAYGAVLRLGGTSLVLEHPAGPAAPLESAANGRRAFNRPPRLRPLDDRVHVVVPAPPAERERQPVPLLAVLAPLLLGIGMWRLTGSTMFLLFTLLSPVLVLGNVVSDRRTGRRRSRRERALWLAAREVAERTLEAGVRADETARRAAEPDPAQVLLTALGPLPRLWERRRTTTTCWRCAWGWRTSRLGWRWRATRPACPRRRGRYRGGAAAEAGVLGVAALPGGSRAAVQALARSLVCGAAVWHSPRTCPWSCWPSRPPQPRGTGWAGFRTPGRTAVRTAARCSASARSRLLPASRSSRPWWTPGGPSCGPRARRAHRPAAGAGRRGRREGAALGARAWPACSARAPPSGCTPCCLEDDPRLLPEECGATALVAASGALTVQVEGRPDLTGAVADLPGQGWAEALARALAPLRDDSRDRSGADGLPPSVRWTEVVHLPLTGGDGDAAGVLERWSSPGRSTRAVLGRGPDGVFSVDLSGDGPHALVAGTTGAGKSELLQTLIASLALANRPDELTFVLVDYKGGAAFGPCARLPHTVGLVTDLDGSRVERALASLAAELSRRETVLQSVGAKDLEEHRRLVGSGTPLPRLVIVVDEFASLVEDLPDFVGGLVAIAMRGRSLGVHLVLATQRPEGVVSPDIRANTNLRLCLAVTRDSESRDVLDSPLAARISRTTPGRAWARTGHADLTAFQAGRVGGRRPSVVARDAAPTVEVLPPADLGGPLPRSRAESPDEQEVTDLSLLVDACAAATTRLGLPPQLSPWLPPLPERLVLADLSPAPDPLAGRPGRVPALAYGMVDVPAEQSRRTLVLDLDRTSHLMVVGSARSGAPRSCARWPVRWPPAPPRRRAPLRARPRAAAASARWRRSRTPVRSWAGTPPTAGPGARAAGRRGRAPSGRPGRGGTPT
jgi:S-DNA-T family DNA segregation ATPase FtsK/SpoIIIE